MSNQQRRNSHLKSNTIGRTQERQIKKGCCCSFCYQDGNFNSTFFSGRNKYLAVFAIGRLSFKFIWGVFDEVSDWIYYVNNKGKFEQPIIEELMLFFLVAQFIVQIIAWMIIFGQLKIADLQRQNQNPLYDIKEKTKLETTKIVFIKLAWYNVYNIAVYIWYMLKSFFPGFLMMILQITKLSPFCIHYYFQKKYQIVITDTLFAKLQERRSIFRENTFKFSDPKYKATFEGINIDSNIKPNLATFIFEADLERYLRMADTIEAIFEALPMAMLQYINNYFKNGEFLEWTLEDQIFFLSSFFTVFIYTITLIQYLFSADAETLWNLDHHLTELINEGEEQVAKIEKKEKDNKTIPATYKEKKKEKELYLFHQFQFPKDLKLKQPDDLLKFQFSHSWGLRKVEILNLHMNTFATDTQNIVQALQLIFPKCKSNHVTLAMEQCNLKLENLKNILEYSTALTSNTLQYDFSTNPKMFEIENKQSQFNDIYDYFSSLQVRKLSLDASSCDIFFEQRLKNMFYLLSSNAKLKEAQFKFSENNISKTSCSFMDEMEYDFDELLILNLDLSDNRISQNGMATVIKYLATKFRSLANLQLNLANQEEEIKEEILRVQVLNKSKSVWNQNYNQIHASGGKQQQQEQNDIEATPQKRQVTNDFQIVIHNSPFRENLKSLSLDISNNHLDDEVLNKVSENFIGQNDKLQNLKMLLNYNEVGDEGMKILFEKGIANLNQLTDLKIDAKLQANTDLTLESVKCIPEQLSSSYLKSLELDFRYNNGLKDSIFKNYVIYFTCDKIKGDQPIKDQIASVQDYNNKFMVLESIGFLGLDEQIEQSFKQNEQLWINFDQKQIWKPEFIGNQETILFDQKKNSKFQKDNEVSLGRVSQSKTPDISFSEGDRSVSRTQSILTTETVKNEEQYYIQCKAGLDNQSSFKIKQKEYYQLYEGCNITLGRKQTAVQIQVAKIGQNNKIEEALKRLYFKRSSKKAYFWDWVEKEEEKQEAQDDDTVVDEEEDDNTVCDDDSVQEVVAMDPNEIELKITHFFGGKEFTYKIKVEEGEENENENENQQQKPGAGIQRSQTMQQQEVEQQQQHKDKTMTTYQNQIKIGASQYANDIAIQSNPFYTGGKIANLHCLIGVKKFRVEDKTVQFWYIKVPNDLDVNEYETFLGMKNTAYEDQDIRQPKFQLADGMTINFGFSLFNVILPKQKKLKHVLRNKSINEKELKSAIYKDKEEEEKENKDEKDEKQDEQITSNNNNNNNDDVNRSQQRFSVNENDEKALIDTQSKDPK